MFHHVVLMTFSTDADQNFFDKVESYCERVRASMPQCRHYVFRKNLASRSDGLTHGILSTFTTSADHDDYQVSALHQEMKSYMEGFIERIVVCDIDEEQS
ncbi:MAG: Dabb family protein [Burkholderiaceae bacterium]